MKSPLIIINDTKYKNNKKNYNNTSYFPDEAYGS